ncbi:DUF4397 domain-containing protein [Thalassotalea sp. PS06]|uniref:DUF4397 domain-containing protein n=1 Tax=Thalassotalea sp. PS06 TaxID=2594005 RepID=UPI00163D874F|nr:DUF4397 domain-containing protein [Thalassotalea sp. PS06]
MKRITKIILPVIMLGVIAGCDDDDNGSGTITPPEPQTPQAMVRVIHGSPDAPAVNVVAAGSAVEALSNLDFAMGTEFLSLDEGTYPLTVDAILADGSTTQVLDLGDVELMGDYEYTVFAHGTVTDMTLAPAVVANPVMPVGDGNIRVQVLHGSSIAPMVDLHVTGVDDELGEPLATLMYGDVTGQVEVPAGVYRVRLVVAEGESMGAVAFDAVLPDLPAGADLFVAATTNTGVPTSPVFLLANDGTDTLKIIDDRTQAWVRVVHAAADVPNVDILVNGNKVDALSNAPFTGVTGNVPVDPGTYMVDTVLTADNSVVGITGDLMLEADMKYTVNAVGTLSGDDDAPLEYYVQMDTGRMVATEAQVRLTHAHPSVGNVDIYVTADGDIANVDPVWSDVPFKADTGFASLPPGDYVVQVTLTGTKTIAIDTGMITLMGGKVYAATAVDNPMGMPANLILMDAFTE